MSLKGKAPEEVSAINVTPLVDVMLVLLIIFMVIAPLLQNNVTVTMVTSHNATDMEAANKTDAAIIAVTRDGAIYFRKDRISEKDVTTKIKDNMANKTDRTVFLRCDERAKYGEVETVVDDIRNAGIEDLAFLTQQNDEAPPAPPAEAGATP
ncbi:MAG TPA: biopolymer transporter ExbD [Terriglobia bacterium]|nr:biopolymer transporter ExbD [Terriglobia bacterium]